MKPAAKFAALNRVVLHVAYHIEHSDLRGRQLLCYEGARQQVLDVRRCRAKGASSLPRLCGLA